MIRSWIALKVYKGIEYECYIKLKCIKTVFYQQQEAKYGIFI